MKQLTTLDRLDEYRSFLNKVIELEGELTPEMEEALSISQANLEEKIEGNSLYYQELSTYVSNLKERFKTLKEQYNKRLSFLEDQMDRVKMRAKIVLDTLEKKKIDTGLTKISLQRTKKVVEIMDESLLSARFLKESVVVTIDKEAIRIALESGEVVDGARLVENEFVKIEVNELKHVGERL